MPFNNGYIACISTPNTPLKKIGIGLNKMAKRGKYKKGKKKAKKVVKGKGKSHHNWLKKKKYKKKKYKKKVTKKGAKKKKKKAKFQMLMNKGNSFGAPSTIKQLN